MSWTETGPGLLSMAKQGEGAGNRGSGWQVKGVRKGRRRLGRFTEHQCARGVVIAWPQKFVAPFCKPGSSYCKVYNLGAELPT